VQVIGTFNSSQGAASPFYNRPVAWRDISSNPSWALVDVPLYYMTSASAASFLERAFTDLGLIPLSVPPAPNLTPFTFRLDPPHPNPFNGVTIASFELRVASRVRLTVWDTAGRLVATLVDGWMAGGNHQATFVGKDLASGVYLLKLEAGDFRAVQKMVMLK
jgi:hypothetical protein